MENNKDREKLNGGCGACGSKKPLLIDFKNGNYALNLSGFPLVLIMGGILYGLYKLLEFIFTLIF